MGKSQRKLFVPSDFNEWLDDSDDIGDIFNRSIDVDKEDFRRILNEKVQIEEVVGMDIALKKVFCADDGDNVPSIFSWIQKKDGKEVLDKNGEPKISRITPVRCQKIIENSGISHYNQLLDQSESILEQIRDISKEIPGFNINDRINRQINLVVLDPLFFPSQIIEDFKEDINKDMAKPHVHPQSWNMQSMLEGTKYIDPNYKSAKSESSIFGEIDRISTKELF